jgi:hypothetical protein
MIYKKLAAALALALLLPASFANGQFYSGDQIYSGKNQKWGPNGNGTLDHQDDIRWVILHDVKITADNAKGIFTAKFGKDMGSMEGRSFSIMGYMMPIETNIHSAHFVLTRRSPGCPFCPPNEPSEAIEIFATKGVDYTQAPIAVKGTLHLVNSSADGLFYRMDHVVLE